MLLTLLVSAAISLAWSALLGWLTLAARRFRNDVLVRRGEPAYRDCVYPSPVVWFVSVVGVIAAAVVVMTRGGRTPAIIAATAPATLLFSVSIGAALALLRRR